MFNIPYNIDPKLKKVLQDIQAVVHELRKKGAIDAEEIKTVVYQRVIGPSNPQYTKEVINTLISAIALGDLTDVTILGIAEGDVLVYSGGAWRNESPTVTDVTASRALGTVYQNTGNTVKVAHVTVEMS